jgi:acetyl-CoA synthetase
VSTEELDTSTYAVPAEWARFARADAAKYRSMYASSASTPDAFWAEHGKRIDWTFTKVKNTSFELGKVSIKWFEDGTTNVAMNCIDRHLAGRASQVAIIWEGDDPAESRHITYAQLHDQVCRFANVLKSHGGTHAETDARLRPRQRDRGHAGNHDRADPAFL